MYERLGFFCDGLVSLRVIQGYLCVGYFFGVVCIGEGVETLVFV